MRVSVYQICLITTWVLISVVVGILTVQASAVDRTIVTNTFWLGLTSSLVAVPLAAAWAWVAISGGLMGRTMMLAMIGLLFMPVFVHVSTWDAALGRLGWLTSTQGQILIPLISGWQAASWIHGVAAAPQVAMLLLIGMLTGRSVFEDQARLDTNSSGVWLSVTLPRMLPLMILGILWTMSMAAREIAATDLYQVGTLAERVYLGFSLGQLNTVLSGWAKEQLQQSNQLNLVLFAAVIGWFSLTAGLIFSQLNHVELAADQLQPRSFKFPHRHAGEPATRRLIGFFRLAIGGLLLAILLVVPVANLVIRCCYAVLPINGFPTTVVSGTQFLQTLQRALSNYPSEFMWSTLIAGTSSTIIVIGATILAWSSRRNSWLRMLMIVSLVMSCAIPGPIVGSLLIQFFTSVDSRFTNWLYDRTIAAPVLANVWFCWLLSPMVIWFVFGKVAEDSLEHANLEGAGELKRFFSLGLAGNWAAVLGCWLITFSVSFGELSASQLVIPPGIDTMPRLMLGLLHAGVDEMTAALTLIMGTMVLTVAAGGWLLISWSWPSTIKSP